MSILLSGGLAHQFLTMILDGGEWSAQWPGFYIPKEEPLIPSDRRQAVLPALVWMLWGREISLPSILYCCYLLLSWSLVQLWTISRNCSCICLEEWENHWNILDSKLPDHIWIHDNHNSKYECEQLHCSSWCLNGMRICTSIVTSMDEEGNGGGQH